MGYEDSQLAPDEKVVFRTGLHPVVFAGTVGFAAFVVGVAGLIVARNELEPAAVRLIWLAATGIAGASFVSPWLRWRTAEFTVTNRRVLVRVGLFAVHTIEIAARTPGAIGVERTIAGRLLGYGTVQIVGPEGRPGRFPGVARPEAFRDAALAEATPPARGRRREDRSGPAG